MPKIYHLSLFTAFLISLKANAQDIPLKQMMAVKSDEAMTIDGLANESVWKRAPISGGFVEKNPNLGAKPPVDTTVQVSYDEDNLYVFVRAQLVGPRARVNTLRRDSGDIFSDDTVSVKIDPLLDRRTVYAFAANVAGAQFDSLTLEDGRVNFGRWDGVWEVQGQVREGEYTLEYKIPFYVLGIKGEKALDMGFNVTRMDPTRAADYDWRLIPPPRSPVGASTFGTLKGVSAASARPVLELTPYGLATTDFSKHFSLNPTRRPNLGVGADLRFQTGPGSYVEGSVLTDFTQVDADQVQVANDRFPLFFPEQRPFFLNGADVFNFGLSRQAQLFFSRRVALDGVVSPVLGGVKAYGRRPKFTYGIMNVQTASVWEGQTREKEPENFSALRFRAQPIRQLAFGVLGVGRKRLDSDRGDALSLGVDLDLQSADGRFRSYNFVATSWNNETEETPGPPPASEPNWGTSASSRTEYRSLFIRPAFTWIWSDKKFAAPLGFYERPNTAQHQAEVNLVPRPDFWGLQEVELRPRVTFVTTPEYQSLLTYEGRMDLALHWKSNWHAGYFFKGVQDKVSSDFALFGDQRVLAGDYEHRTHTLWMSSPDQYALSAWLSYEGGKRFGGSYHRFDGELNLRAGRHFMAKGAYTHFAGKLPSASKRYSVGSANAQLIAAFNTNLVFDTMLRLDLTPGQRRLSTQARLKWRYRPGSDLFVVYVNQHPLDAHRAQGPLTQDHRLTLKLNWYLAVPMGARR